MRQISEKRTASYTEIMQVLNLDPSLMSGTFNYHLKELTEAGLIERTNGEYQITDLGKRALILVDQVAKDVKIDQYGVLSAVISMSPKRELELFMSQMGMMIGFVMSILCIIPMLIGYASDVFAFWFSGLALLFFLTLALVSGAKMVGIVRRFHVGFSAVLFLSINWYFIRSANRNRFFVITLLTVVAILLGALSLLLPFTGEIMLLSPEWFIIVISAISSTITTIILCLQARKRVEHLEESSSEQ